MAEPYDDTSQSSSCCTSKSVRFGECVVRSYSHVLGDHPYSSMVCPLSLGWEYEALQSLTVDDYELTRGRRLSSQELRLSRGERRSILQAYSDAELMLSSQEKHNYDDSSRSSRIRHFFDQQTIILRTIREAPNSKSNRVKIQRTEEKLGPKVRKNVEKEQSEILQRMKKDQEQKKSSTSSNEVRARTHELGKQSLDSFFEEQGAIWNQIQKERNQPRAKNATQTSPDNKRKSLEGGGLMRRRSRQRLLALDSSHSFGRIERRESLERAQIEVKELGSRSFHEQKSELYQMAQQLRLSYAKVSD